MALPPRPWHVAVPQPPRGSRVYVVDATGRQVFDASVDEEIADHVVALVNKAFLFTAPALTTCAVYPALPHLCTPETCSSWTPKT